MYTKQTNVILFILCLGLVSCNSQANISSTVLPTKSLDSPYIESIQTTPFELPTLPESERFVQHINLIKNQENCRLPCVLQLTPGKVSWGEANNFLESNGFKVFFDEIANNYSGASLELQEELFINNFTFSVEDDILVSGKFLFSNYNDELFSSTLESYSIENVFRNYGTPSRVWFENSLRLESGNEGTVRYGLWLFYDQLQFLVRFSGFVNYAPSYLMCPSLTREKLQIDSMYIYVQQESNNAPIETLAGLDVLSPDVAKNLEEVLGVSLNEFYDLFSGSGKACLEITLESS